MFRVAKPHTPRVGPTPIPVRGSWPMTGNRLRQFDLGSIKPGDVLRVNTGQSDWYFTRTANSRVTASEVHGVFIQTSSRAFGQITRDPANVIIQRVIEKDDDIWINGRKATGPVDRMWLNGSELT